MKKTALIILFCMAFVMLFSMLSRTSQVNAATDYVIDTFTRSVSNGWGTAETGGIYGISTASDYNVTSSAGTIRTGANVTKVANSATISVQDTQHLVRVKAGTAPAGGNMSVSIVARNIGVNNNYYRGKLIFATNQQMYINFSRLTNGVETDLASNTTLSDTFVMDTYYWIKFQVEGTSPTNLRIKVWQDGSAEPSSWGKTAKNSQPELQTNGYVGLQTYVSSISTVAPVLYTFDDYAVTDIPFIPTNTPTPTPTPYATASDTFTRTTANGWGSADTGVIIQVVEASPQIMP